MSNPDGTPAPKVALRCSGAVLRAYWGGVPFFAWRIESRADTEDILRLFALHLEEAAEAWTPVMNTMESHPAGSRITEVTSAPDGSGDLLTRVVRWEQGEQYGTLESYTRSTARLKPDRWYAPRLSP